MVFSVNHFNNYNKQLRKQMIFGKGSCVTATIIWKTSSKWIPNKKDKDLGHFQLSLLSIMLGPNN